MTEIVIVCFIVGLSLMMTIRWLRKKVSGKSGNCCGSETSCGCNPASGGGLTDKTKGPIDGSLPREGG